MKEVKQTELFKLKDLFEKVIPEMNMSKRMSAAESVVKLDRAYTGNYLKCFTDDIDDPKHLLVLGHFPSMLSSGFVCVVYLMYSVPEERGKKFNDLHRIVDNYASIHNCDEILGGSWIYQNCKGIDNAWISKGYVPQEKTYIKILNQKT